MSGVQSTSAYSYACNPASGEIHLVVVSRDSVRMTNGRCWPGHMAAPLTLISDDEAWAAFEASPESWCGHCSGSPAEREPNEA